MCVTPWTFPYLTSDYWTQLLLMLGIVLLFCDAPFIDAGQPYLLIRSGRIHWGLGQVLYIMLGTAIYFLFAALLSILTLMPNILLDDGWGKVFSTLAQTNAGISFDIDLTIAHKIQILYSPVHAFALSLLLEWCAGTILGLIMFITNIYWNRSLGAIAAIVIVLFDAAVYNNYSIYYNYISPVSLARLTILDPTHLSNYPSNQYAFVFFLVSIIGLEAIVILSVRKQPIQVLPPL